MKKSKLKMMLVAILGLIAFSPTAFAKNMTLAELGTLLESNPNYDGSYAYIVGEYVFTSSHTLTIQDIMMGANSIELDKTYTPQEFINKMTVFEIRKTHDTMEDLINGNFKWVVYEKNYLGTDTLNTQNLDIRFINYEFIPEVTDATLTIATANEVSSFENYNISSVTLNNNTVSGLLLQNKKVTNTSIGNGVTTNYYIAYTIDVPDATNSTTIKVDNKAIEGNIVNGKTTILLPIKDKTITHTIEIDKDGLDLEYTSKEYKISYSNVIFEKDSNANISTISDQELKSLYKNYQSSINPLKLTNNNGYALSGNALEQEDLISAGKTGYYIPFSVTAIPTGENIKSMEVTINGKTTTTENDISKALSILYEVPTNVGEEISISVKFISENEGEYLPVTYTVNCSNVNYTKNSNTTGKIDNKETNNYLLLNNNEVTGFVAKSGDKYYIPYTITPKEVTEGIKVEVTGGENYGYDNFNGSGSLTINYEVSSGTNSFKVIVDLDGDGTLYEPYTTTIDYSNIQYGEFGALDYAYEHTKNFESITYKTSTTRNGKTNSFTKYIVRDHTFAGESDSHDVYLLKYDSWYGGNTDREYMECKPKTEGYEGNACTIYIIDKNSTDWIHAGNYLRSSIQITDLALLGDYIDRTIPGTITAQEDNTITIELYLDKEKATTYFHANYGYTFDLDTSFLSAPKITVTFDKEKNYIKSIEGDFGSIISDSKDFKFKLEISDYNETSLDTVSSELPNRSELPKQK